MYGQPGQGNYAPQFGQPLPAPPPPPFQQGPPAPQQSIAQLGPPSIPPPVVQHGTPAYGHASSAPHVQVPQSGMLSSGPSYLIPLPPPPPQMRGNAPVPHSYSTSQQNSQWSLNAQHIPPQIPPLGHHPPPRMLPPLPPQGQPFYRGPVHPPQAGGVLTFQHAPPPPPPPPSSQYFIPSPGGTFIQSGHEPALGHLPLPPPPPPPPPPSSPPPGPPPLPPSSPPPSSSLPFSAPLLAISDPNTSSKKPSDVEVMASDLVDGVSGPHHTSDDVLTHNIEECIQYEAGSLLKPGQLSEGNLTLDLPSPPPRPAEEKIVRKIEVLCHYIAKNGHEFEDMTRQKEFGNPEFKFLFGGEPGSEAAVAHEYFLWMKKKCSLTGELLEGGLRDDSSLRLSGCGSSLQPNSVTDAGVSHSPVDSDMDMEDDITQPDEGLGICKSLGSANQEPAKELYTKEPLHANNAGHISDKDAILVNLISSGSSGLVEQAVNDGEYFKKLSVKGGGLNAECSSDSTAKRFHVSPNETLNQSNASGAAGDNSPKVTNESNKGPSPFSLLQDYASDDSSENVEDVSPAAVSPSNGAAAKSTDNFPTSLGIKDLPELKKGVGPSSVPVVTCSLGITSRSPAPSNESEKVDSKADLSMGGGNADDSPENQVYLDAGTSLGAFQEKNYLGGGRVDTAPESTKSHKEDSKSNSNQLKVDEFGRLHKAGASDSDSDDAHYTRRRGKRGRSRSRSRSPKDSRRRRSPVRRREKRSRSRSWSPKKRRSRSKSPSYRRGDEAGGDRSRRDRGQLPDCFDFLRGKCFRGASCRYFHDSDKVEGSRWHRGRQQHEDVSPRLKISEKSVHQHDEASRPEVKLYQDVHGSSSATQGGGVAREAILVTARISDQPPLSGNRGELVIADVADNKIAQELATQDQEMQAIQEEPVESTNNHPQPETPNYLENNLPAVDAVGKKLQGDLSQRIPSSFGHRKDQEFQANFSDTVLQNSDNEPQQIKNSSTSLSANAQSSTTASQLPVNESQASQNSLIQSNPDTHFLTSAYSSEHTSSRELLPVPAHLSHPQLPVPQVSQGTNISFPPPSDYSMMLSTTKYPSHSASGENYTPYQSPMPYQHSHFSVPPTSSWNLLPPPPPHAPHGGSLSQFPQNQPPPRSGYSSQTFARPYATELPNHSQAGEFPHGRYPPVPELDRRLSHTEEFRATMFPGNYSMTQQLGGSSLVGEDNVRPPVHSLISSNSYSQGNIHPQPGLFSRDSPSRRIQSLSGDILPPGELPSLEGHPYLPPYGLQGSAVNNISANLGDSGKINLRYSSDFLDRNHRSHLSEFGRSRISNHYNPYASTFDQPLSTKFSSSVLNQEQGTSYGNKYGGQSSLSRVPSDGQVVGNHSSRNMVTSPNSAQKVVQILPKSGSDQYDPIFDSIEPSSSSFKRSDRDKSREANDRSDVILRHSASNKPLDHVENNVQKEMGAVALSASAENDEFGETADAEVGAVENGSPSDPIDLENLAAGDIEIDQVKTPGKSKKKSKDSRSMKLFKVSLADFVKEVLKPSWRQGNMSKEAFKTIVKKTVDKVSGAMKSHQVPKSQAKINHYIDSSQRKLTKLVMGYVDKYVKV